MSFNHTISLLKKLNIKPSKNLGQNFLVDKNILSMIISRSDLSNSDVVLEVGTGLGILTKEILKRVKKVISYEIDKRLYDYLSSEFSIYDNLELINEDILKSEIPKHNKVVSNIPYKITGPILEKLFYNENSTSGTLIIEKSISDKLKDYQVYQNFSRVSVTFNAFMNLVSMSEVSRNGFYPVPNIKLSLIKIEPLNQIHPFLYGVNQKKFFINFVSNLTPYKNKSISNAIYLFLKNKTNSFLSKTYINQLLEEINMEKKKLFLFNINELLNISEILYIKIINKLRNNE